MAGKKTGAEPQLPDFTADLRSLHMAGRLRDLGDIGLAGPVVPNLHDPVDRANHACGSWAVPPVGPLSMLFGFRRKKQRAGIKAESNPSPGAPQPGRSFSARFPMLTGMAPTAIIEVYFLIIFSLLRGCKLVFTFPFLCPKPPMTTNVGSLFWGGSLK